MIGIILTAISTLTTEIGLSIGKYTIGKKENRIYALGAISSIGSGIVLLLFGFFVPKDFFGSGIPGGFVFSAASLPFLVTRIFLDIAQSHITLLALARTERSAFGFIRIITLPLLLLTDLVLGYQIAFVQICGVAVIIVGLLLLFLNHGIPKKGAFLTLFTALNAVVTISLYKYNITHFNSVATEQSIVTWAIVIYFLFLSFVVAKQNPFKLLRYRRYYMQFFMGTIDSITISFAYLFAPASVITSAKRALSILFAIGAGNFYFGEKHVLLKLTCFVLVAGGVVMLVL